MSTKTQKKDRELRREIEILKAQLKTDDLANVTKTSGAKISSSHKSVTAGSVDKTGTASKDSQLVKNKNSLANSTTVVSEDAYVKADLTKTFVLSIIAFTIIIALWMLSINNINVREKILGLF